MMASEWDSLRGKARWLHRKPKEKPDHLIRPQSEQHLVVGSDAAGMRLDLFLSKRLYWRSRTNIQQLLEERDIRVDGERRKRTYRLKPGQVITIPLPPPPPEIHTIGQVPLNILYEDDALVVVNKPPGVLVHPVGATRFYTIISALHLRYRDLENPERDIVPKLAHRLDKDTSGVLVACKTDKARRDLYFQFQRGEVQKEYLAIVEGEMEQNEMEVDLPIGLAENSEIRIKRGVRHEGGAAALTHFQVVERASRFTLVAAYPVTGRQHQIRVHLEAIGHPILCDRLYGRREKLMLSDLRPLKEGEGDMAILDRQALHAHRLRILHPLLGEPLDLCAPLAEDMAKAWEEIKNHGKAVPSPETQPLLQSKEDT